MWNLIILPQFNKVCYISARELEAMVVAEEHRKSLPLLTDSSQRLLEGALVEEWKNRKNVKTMHTWQRRIKTLKSMR
jgi:hypothetical protein